MQLKKEIKVSIPKRPIMYTHVQFLTVPCDYESNGE